MNFKEYVENNKLSLKELSGKYGVTPQYLYMIAAGTRRASPELARKIDQDTNGQVSAMELLYPQK